MVRRMLDSDRRRDDVNDPNCHCAPVRASLDELYRTVEKWARAEQPRPENVDMLTRDAEQRIRVAALDASIEKERDR